MSNNYKIVEEQPLEPAILPKRVQTLCELYLKAGKNIGLDKKFTMHYQLETEDRHEKIFEDKLRQKPDSLKILITALYRVRHDNQEWFYYNMTRTCKNALNNPERFSYDGYGRFKCPVVSLRFNQEKGTSLPEVTAYEHYFELPWNKEAVKKLLESSSVPCSQFYVGKVGSYASEPIASPYYSIQNKEDFLNGSFEDLMDLGRLGISYKEPSLYMVEAARKKERENRESTVGMREPKLYQ